MHFPHLLSYEQQVVSGVANRCKGLKRDGKIATDLVEENWDLLKQVATEKLAFSDLPMNLREGS